MWFLYIILGLIIVPIIVALVIGLIKSVRAKKLATNGVVSKIKNKPSVLSITSCVILYVYSVILIALLIWALIFSLTDFDLDIRQNSFNYLTFPKKIKFSNYSTVFAKLHVLVESGAGTEIVTFPRMFLNSLIYGLGLGFCGALAPCLVAYAVSKFKFKFNKIVDGIVIVTMILPVVGALSSQMNLVYNVLHWDNSLIALCFMGFSFTNMYYFIFKSAFNSLPSSISEAAHIDGASNSRVFLTIMLPLVRVTFFSIMLLVFLSSWNNYTNIIAFAPTKPTAAYGMYLALVTNNLRIDGGSTSGASLQMAAAMCLMVPVMIMYISLNKKLLGNLTMGGVKG